MDLQNHCFAYAPVGGPPRCSCGLRAARVHIRKCMVAPRPRDAIYAALAFTALASRGSPAAAPRCAHVRALRTARPPVTAQSGPETGRANRGDIDIHQSDIPSQRDRLFTIDSVYLRRAALGPLHSHAASPMRCCWSSLTSSLKRAHTVKPVIELFKLSLAADEVWAAARAHAASPMLRQRVLALALYLSSPTKSGPLHKLVLPAQCFGLRPRLGLSSPICD